MGWFHRFFRYFLIYPSQLISYLNKHIYFYNTWITSSICSKTSPLTIFKNKYMVFFGKIGKILKLSWNCIKSTIKQHIESLFLSSYLKRKKCTKIFSNMRCNIHGVKKMSNYLFLFLSSLQSFSLDPCTNIYLILVIGIEL